MKKRRPVVGQMTWLESLQLRAGQLDPWAQFTLGLCYDHGRGVEQDFVEAAKWYRKAAYLGHAEAQFTLGVMHVDGQGVGQDYVLAHMWFNLSAAQEFENAARNRDVIAELMPPDQLALAQRLARDWKPSTERSSPDL